MKFQNVIEIQVPVEKVFGFVAQMENVPRWNYYVNHVQQTAGQGPEVGAQYHQVRKSDEQDFHITEYEPGHSLTMTTLPGSKPVFERRMHFEPTAQGTRVLDQWTINSPFPGFIESLALGRMRDAVAENLGKLKELLETGQTRLQDGRISQLG